MFGQYIGAGRIEADSYFYRGNHWWRKSAEQGDSGSQSELAMMYEEGHGVPMNYVLALMWYNIAATDLYRPWAAKERDRLTKLMTSAQIAEAQRLAGEWRPKAE